MGRSRGRFDGLDLGPVAPLLVALAGFVLLVGVILWLDNAQGSLTGNGIFKTAELTPWIRDPATAPLYPSNYLFYPVYGALCRALDALGVWAGEPRRQLTLLNAASASLALAIVYRLARALGASRLLAGATALFHLASAFVLILAVTNEDIMPSYTVMLLAMALAAVWFARPTVLRVAVVSVLFSLGWLFEWRLMFPALPALLAALWLARLPMTRRPLTTRLGLIAVLLAGTLATACAMAWAWRGHPGAVGPLDLMWTGKGVSSAWAGFTAAKVGLLRDGIASYLLGTALTRVPAIGWDLWRYTGFVLVVGLGAIAACVLWPRRGEPMVRSAVAVFGGAFVAGEVFNLYSQPQDPQMQLNVMPGLTLAFLFAGQAAAKRWRWGTAAMAGLAALLLVHNLASLAPLRGLDTRWRLALEALERRADPARTVFVVHDFDWMMSYGQLHWGVAEPGPDLGPPPQPQPKFKWIGLLGPLLRHHDWTVEQQAAELRRQIDRALALGYDVLLVRLGHVDDGQLARESGMVASPAQLAAFRTVLAAYPTTPAFTDPLIGPFDRLSPQQ